MDTHTLNLDFGEGEDVKLRGIQLSTAKAIANLELITQKQELAIRENQAILAEMQTTVHSLIEPITQAISELQSLMTEVGVARWHAVNREALDQARELIKTMEGLSHQHLDKINKSQDEVNELAKKSFARLDRAMAYTIKNISDVIGSFRIGDFQRLTEQSREIVEETSVVAINRLKESVRWFQWKNIGLAVSITIFATITIGLYMSDELPWEIHKQVMAQRNAGQALIHAWHTLSEDERQRILQHANKAII